MKLAIDLRTLYNSRISGIEKYTISLVNELIRQNHNEQFHLIGNSALLNEKPSSFIQESITTSSKVEEANKVLALKGFLSNWDIYFSPYQPIPERRTYKGVITVHDCIPLRYPDFFPKGTYTHFDVYLRRSLNSIDHVIADSHSTKKDVVDFYNVDESKISVIHLAGMSDNLNKIILKKKDEVINKYGINSPYMLSVCTIEPRKNLIRTLKSFEIIRSRRKKKIKLVLVGSLGWGYSELMKLIHENDYKDDIILTGYVPEEDLPVLYKNAELFLYPSLFEGFGLPVLEAMGYGTPVVTSNISSLPEVGGGAVEYCDPYDTESITHAIEEVILSNGRQTE